MKRIPQVPAETSLKEDKLADRVARRNPKVYDGSDDLVVLEKWIRWIEKIFTVAEVQEDWDILFDQWSWHLVEYCEE